MPGSPFLIDARFIVERINKDFLGAPLMAADGKDHTFTFGFMRDFLRLRRNLGITAGIVIFGREVYSISIQDRLLDLIAFLREIRIPHRHDPLNLTLHIVGPIYRHFSHIVTDDRRFLQFCTKDFTVVLPRNRKQTEWNWTSPDAVKRTIGVHPSDIPTYLALTEQVTAHSLTNKQAVRLIELCGGSIDSIYGNMDARSNHIRRRLKQCEAGIRARYREAKYDPMGDLVFEPIEHDCLDGLDTTSNRQVLKRYKFSSLLPLLANPSSTVFESRAHLNNLETYHVVNDLEGTKMLEALILTSKRCAIDTECDSEDPREATLLGVSFSIKEGAAYFVPLTDPDLKGLCHQDVIKILERIFISDVDFIGHNIKYDYLVLRRCGIIVKHIHFDTMLAACECHGDWPFFNLAYVCKRYLGEEIKSYSDLVGAGGTLLDVPLRDLADYACQDADMCLRLYPILLSRLQERTITAQFFNHNMRQLVRLANLEFDGIEVDVERINGLTDSVLEQFSRLKSQIATVTGKECDIESPEEVFDILRETVMLRGYVVPRRTTDSSLEHLAMVEPVARLVVESKRLRRLAARLKSISSAVRDGRIFPLFSQIKSRTGMIASSDPGIFDLDGSLDLRSCFDDKISDLFADAKTSLKVLAEVTKDPILIKRSNSGEMIGGSIIEDLSATRELDPNDAHLLLRFAIAESDLPLAKRYLANRSKIAAMRNDMEKRYETMFRWLSHFRRLAQASGYATNGALRKYIDGLKSSDMSKRAQALEYAVRWLIRY
jgi:DNA polymerase-1